MLVFKCNSERHRPLMEALTLLQRYRERKTSLFPLKEDVPLDGVVKEDWQDLVLDNQQGGRVNRISYEICVLTTLRERLRCKEIWVVGAHRFRNPDEDLPQDFDARRDEYYMALEQPRDATVFVAQVRRALEGALTVFTATLPANPKVKILTSKNGKGRILLTPLVEQPEPPTFSS